MNIYFHTNLKYLLKRLKVSQEELASHVKVRGTTISNYINRISSPGLNELVAICQFFGISVDTFLFEQFDDNTVTEDEIQSFKQKGKVFFKPLNTSNKKKAKIYTADYEHTSTVNEGEETLQWALFNLLKQIDVKLDSVQKSINEKRK